MRRSLIRSPSDNPEPLAHDQAADLTIIVGFLLHLYGSVQGGGVREMGS